MKNYDDFTDEELVERFRKGEAGLEDYLIEKYKGLVLKKAHMLFIVGGEQEDLIQEGMIGLFKALRDYDPDKNAAFSTFATICVERQLFKAVEMSGRLKNKPLNSYISLSEEENPLVRETGFHSMNPESIVIDRENVRLMQEAIKKQLSAFENRVLELYLEGMTYLQIAEKMEKSPKAIDNAIQRIRGKIKRFLQKE